MSDVHDAGSAPAPAESTPAPANVPITNASPPQERGLGSQTPVGEKPAAPPEPKKETPPPSARDAVRAANEKLKADADKPKPEPAKEPAPKAEAPKPETPRGEHGHFAPKDPQPATQPAPTAQPQQPAAQRAPHDDAPARFSEAAKGEWANAPEGVRAETHRAITELTNGIEKHRQSAQEWERLKPYDDMAKQYGTTVQNSLANYTAIDRALSQNPIQGLQLVAQHAGFSLRDVAAQIMGQSPDQVSSQQDQTINQLRQQISRLEQGLGGIQQNFHQQQLSQTEAQVAQFAKDNPRFEELSEDIAFFLKSGRTQDLGEAYKLAERLNPAPATAPDPAASTAAPAPKPLNPAGQKSVSGAPSGGSAPLTNTGPVPTPREALKRALAQAGRV